MNEFSSYNFILLPALDTTIQAATEMAWTELNSKTLQKYFAHDINPKSFYFPNQGQKFYKTYTRNTIQQCNILPNVFLV